MHKLMWISCIAICIAKSASATTLSSPVEYFPYSRMIYGGVQEYNIDKKAYACFVLPNGEAFLLSIGDGIGVTNGYVSYFSKERVEIVEILEFGTEGYRESTITIPAETGKKHIIGLDGLTYKWVDVKESCKHGLPV